MIYFLNFYNYNLRHPTDGVLAGYNLLGAIKAKQKESFIQTLFYFLY